GRPDPPLGRRPHPPGGPGLDLGRPRPGELRHLPQPAVRHRPRGRRQRRQPRRRLGGRPHGVAPLPRRPETPPHAPGLPRRRRACPSPAPARRTSPRRGAAAPAETRLPDVIHLDYRVKTNSPHAPATSDADLEVALDLPVTTPPAQVPKIVSAGLALSKYQRN